MAKMSKIKIDDSEESCEEKKSFLRNLRKDVQSANLNCLIGSGCSMPAIRSWAQ